MEEMMNNNEIMDTVEDFAENSGSNGKGLYFLAGAAVTGLVYAGYRLVKKKIRNKKNHEDTDENVDAEEVKTVEAEVTDED